jgi:hypothetical protein
MSTIHLFLIVSLSTQPGAASPLLSAAPSVLDLGSFPSRTDCTKAAQEAATPSNVVSLAGESLNSANKAIEKAQDDLDKATKEAAASPGDPEKRKEKQKMKETSDLAKRNADDLKNYAKKGLLQSGIFFLCVDRGDGD